MGKGLGSPILWSLAYMQICGSHVKIVINETAKEYLNFKTQNDTKCLISGFPSIFL
jgi:hypothetical protein